MINNLQNVEILLVEDNQDDANLLIKTLEKNNIGNKLLHLGNGVDALNFLLAEGKFSERKIQDKPRLILLDLKMPKLDGIQVLRMIRHDDRIKNIPVVIVTSSSDATDLIESYKLGITSYIIKPLDFKDLVKVFSDLDLSTLLNNELTN